MVERLRDFAVKMTGCAPTMRSMNLKKELHDWGRCDHQILGAD